MKHLVVSKRSTNSRDWNQCYNAYMQEAYKQIDSTVHERELLSEPPRYPETEPWVGQSGPGLLMFLRLFTCAPATPFVLCVQYSCLYIK
jgi:hypothetical protein